MKHYRRGYREGQLPKRSQPKPEKFVQYVHPDQFAALEKLSKESRLRRPVLVRRLLAYALRRAAEALIETRDLR